jgi:hypothetical protein
MEWSFRRGRIPPVPDFDGKAVTDQDNDLLSLTILDRSSTASPTILPSQMLCCSGKGHWSILSNAYASGRRRLEWI